MRCAIMQPNYLPWTGYFNLIYNCDTFVFLDHVQYTKNEWINRNRIKTPQGWTYLTVPIKTQGKLHQSILEAKIANNLSWRKNHWRAIQLNYTKAPYYKNYQPIFEEIYSQNWQYISELNIHCIIKILEILGLKKEIIYSSELKVAGQKDDLVINICKSLKADEYFSPLGANVYIENNKFIENKIKLTYQDYSKDYPVYPQLWGSFIPNLSIIDLIFNCGPSSINYINQYQ